MRLFRAYLFLFILKTSAIFYKSPTNLSYFWNFGFFGFIFLSLQIITGIFLGMFYTPEPVLAFNSIIDITNEIYFG